jgi:hypothetical protein
MKFDNQKRQHRIEALAGSICLKARLHSAITGFDRQISLGRTEGTLFIVLFWLVAIGLAALLMFAIVDRRHRRSWTWPVAP